MPLLHTCQLSRFRGSLLVGHQISQSPTLRAESLSIFIDKSGKGKKTLLTACTFHIEHAFTVNMYSMSVTRDQWPQNENKRSAIRHCIPNKSTSQRIFSKNDKTVADEFNQFFVSVGQSTVDKITSLANECNLTLNQNYFTPRQYALSDQFTLSTIDYKQIERIITMMPSNKAPGIDKIPIRVIKDCLNPIVHTITSIVNASFLTCVFPSKWKTAEVTPIPKDGDHEQANNNRPISLLPVLSKVCERVVHNQLTSYLQSNDTLSKTQSGNKKWHSCETSVIETTDTILNAIDKKKLTAVVLLDMTKAFDSVNHETLILKLQDVGTSSHTLQWVSQLPKQQETSSTNPLNAV